MVVLVLSGVGLVLVYWLVVNGWSLWAVVDIQVVSSCHHHVKGDKVKTHHRKGSAELVWVSVMNHD